MTVEGIGEQLDLLQGLGCSVKVAEAIERLYREKLLMPQLPDETIDHVLQLPEAVALQAVAKFRASDFTTVISRPAFFLGIIRSYKMKLARLATDVPADLDLSTDSARGSSPSLSPVSIVADSPPKLSKNGPDKLKLARILLRSGYPHEVSGYVRRYGGPPPNWTGQKPGSGCELFVGRVPNDVFEDDLIPLFEKVGKLYEMRIVTDEAGYNRGYAFVTYCEKDSAKKATLLLDGHEIKPGRKLAVSLYVLFNRLYVGGIPRSKTKQQIFAAFSAEVPKLTDVIVLEPKTASPGEANRGFCFLEFDSYFDAAAARKRLMKGRTRISSWDDFSRFTVDWAIPLENPDEDVAARSSVILVTNLSDAVTNDKLLSRFGKYGKVTKVNKKGHYAFVTYAERGAALAAEEAENQQTLEECQMQVQLHTPLTAIAKRMVARVRGPLPAPSPVMMAPVTAPGHARPPLVLHPVQSHASFGLPRRAGAFTKARILARRARASSAVNKSDHPQLYTPVVFDEQITRSIRHGVY